jgi:two-component system alkaline phosphatase synthesis response regulator PhoP/two-component system response regulator ResD
VSGLGSQSILVVDDEANIIDLCKMYLEREGYRVITASDGQQALDQVSEAQPDLVVLDLMLPVVDGFEVCRRIRAEGDLPVLMLTARDDDVDKIVGLELGADDYVTKPFNPRELVARVKAILRRAEAKPPEAEGPVVVGDVRLDPLRHETEIAGQPLELRAKEFDLLLAFARNPGIVLSRQQLLDRVWGFEFLGQTRTVDVHVAHLRKYLRASDEVSIETITGVGYKLVS